MRGAAMIRWMVIAALVCSAEGCRRADQPPEAGAGANAIPARLDRLLGGLHEAGRFDGAVVVSDARGIVFERGYGWADAERKVPFTPDTPTDGASLAKTFTAALALALRDDGRLDLDAPVQRWLPELPYPDVTLRHLLSHSSGIPVHDYDFFDRDLPPGTVRTTESLLRVLATRRPPLAAPPGTTFEYSSFGYDLAALATARAGGKAWFDLLAERFLTPLGMTSVFVRPGRLADFPGVRTRGYRRDGDRLVPNEVFEDEAFHGGSNLYLSVRDLDRWSVSFLRAPRLAPAALAADLEPATIGGARSGLTVGSWYRRSDGRAHWYSGHLKGFHSEALRDEVRGWSIAYTSNNTIDPWLQKGLVRAIVAVLEGAEPAAPGVPAVERIAMAQRAGLAGHYVLADGTAFEVEAGDEAGDDALRVRRDGVTYRAFPAGPATFGAPGASGGPAAFYAPGLDTMIGFARGTSPSEWKMAISTNVGEEWAVRYSARSASSGSSRVARRAGTQQASSPAKARSAAAAA
jgi:CubicO group peptidase (beta-lactamase class C family)